MTTQLERTLLKPVNALRKLIQDPGVVTRHISELGAKSGKQAFVDQRLGDIIWDERYKGDNPPPFNYAGVIQDFNSGLKTPKPNRFLDRPAAYDTGALQKSVRSLAFNPSI